MGIYEMQVLLLLCLFETIYIYSMFEEVKENYKIPSIISGTSAAIWSRTNFGPTGRHHPVSSLLLHVFTVSSTSAIFKCILEVVFCEGEGVYVIQPRSPHLCQNGGLSVLSSTGETEK
jgi:hypothetical protein